MHSWVPFVRTPSGVLWAGDSSLSWGILPVDQMEQKAAGMKSLALRNGNGNVSNTFGSSLPRLENEIERGNTNNLCIKLSLLLLEAPAASIRESLLSFRAVERCFCSGHSCFCAISLLPWGFGTCFYDFLLSFPTSSLPNIKRHTFPNDSKERSSRTRRFLQWELPYTVLPPSPPALHYNLKTLCGGLGFAGELEKAPPDIPLDVPWMHQSLLPPPLTQPISQVHPLNQKSPFPQGLGTVVQVLR